MKCCKKELSFGPEHQEVSEAQCPTCSSVFQRKAGQNQLYYMSENGTQDWKCSFCGSTIMCVDVSYPVHDGLFPESGSGKVEMGVLPFCPKCEARPEFIRKPVIRKSVFV